MQATRRACLTVPCTASASIARIYGCKIANGMCRELEASLSCRQDHGEPVSVRCIFRDVTAQYQRERRLAMQLAVSQVVGESTTSDEALPAMLESLGTNLGFDMAGLWFVSSDHHTALPGRLVCAGSGVH